MKKFLLGSAALIALVSQASAADMAPRPYTKAPPMIAAVYDWTGFYIGANGGYGSSRKCWDYRGTVTAPLVTSVAEGCHDADGATAGGQIGYRWQTGAWVFGVEAQGNWADFRGQNASLAFPAFTNRSRVDAFGLFTGQVGYAWNNTLFYVKGGGAVTDDRYNYFTTLTGTNVGTARETRFGTTVGAGLEFGFTPNWSFGVEYNHLFMGDRDRTFVSPASTVDRIRQEADIVTARINYRWGGPVVARY